MVSRKPSIFSKNYQKKIRRRKIRYVTLIVVVIVIFALGITLFYKGDSLQGIKEFFNKENSQVEGNKGTDNEPQSPNEEGTSETPKEDKESSIENYEVALESGEKIKVTYKISNDEKKIQIVDSGLNIKGYVSPSQKKLLILNEEKQDIFILNEERELIKITNPQYVSTDNQTFTKESVLSFNPSYKWISGASFIDDNHVAYASALPWINEGENLYLWIVDLSTGIHKGYYNIKGKDFVFKEAVEKGLTIQVDGKDMIVNSSGSIQ